MKLDNTICDCREALREISKTISEHESIGNSAMAHLVAARALIENQIAVLEAGICKVH